MRDCLSIPEECPQRIQQQLLIVLAVVKSTTTTTTTTKLYRPDCRINIRTHFAQFVLFTSGTDYIRT